MQSNTPESSRESRCQNCWKSSAFCLCGEIHPEKSRLQFLVLQHPREAKAPLGTARLASLSIEGAVHKVGLSWRSLSNALGKPAIPSEWAVLFLGGLKASRGLQADKPISIYDRHEQPVDPANIKGIVILDGSWKQSKTLWWRNAWLLKLNRAVLAPPAPSEYTPVRKQPRKECLSTIEAMAESLAALEPSSPAPEQLRVLFRKHVERAASLH